MLIDAKGHHDQFIDPRTGFQDWFTRVPGKGLQQMMDDAARQVRAAGAQPVEWWCHEQSVARALNRAFANDPALAGKIRAVFTPMEG